MEQKREGDWDADQRHGLEVEDSEGERGEGQSIN